MKKIKLQSIKNLAKQFTFATGLLYVSMNNALAAVSGEAMPWEGPLEKIMDSISGPVAKVLGVIVIVIAGFGIAFGESGSGVRRLFQVVFGLAIAFTAASIVTDLFQPSAGVVF